ncbi:hypothetical protein [Nocardioides sambongensis]|uniref:hypothetical protein n=1 Tax=Nocardioides sambongensis TaxID=2589074 RepID=UPI00112BCD47|nr:hypothetical protein [Nocardioides sambongensis]
MASPVTSINVRRDRLEATIRADLIATGQARSTQGADVAAWRRAARRAARSLGRPVQTVLVEDGAAAAAMLRDWPASPAERAQHQAAMRRVVDRAAAAQPTHDPA